MDNMKLKLNNKIFEGRWFKKLFKKQERNIQINLIVGQSKREPKNQPIIFESMKDGFEYFRQNP